MGERVRLFVLNAGPSGTSSFHVVGTIWDRVWFEGIMVDHEFADANAGAIGLIDATGP